MQKDLKELIMSLQMEAERGNGQCAKAKNNQPEASRHYTEIDCGADAQGNFHRTGDVPIPHRRA